MLPIEDLIDEIKFKEFGSYYIIEGDNLSGQVLGCARKISENHPLLSKHYELIAEMLLNATSRGNNNDPNLSASVKVILGEKGWIVRIRDSGEGFDYNKVLRYDSYQGTGNGFRLLRKHDELEFSFQDGGRTFNLMGFYK